MTGPVCTCGNWIYPVGYSDDNNDLGEPIFELAKTLIGQEISISFESNKFGKTVKDLIPL